MITANICYIINKNGEVLLQKKARGLGVGNWNGPGGKSKPGETPEEAVRREVTEETTIKIGNIKKIAHLEFIYKDKRKKNFNTHVFECFDYIGEPIDTGEGELKWFKKEDIPLDKMWDDDRYWLMDALNGEFKKMRFWFNEDGKVIKYENL